MQASNKAFTLIEVLVVLLIMASLFSMVANRLYSKNKKIKSTFIELVQLNRRLQTLSEVHRKEYRLIFKVYKNGPDKYWVEKKEIQITEEEQKAQEEDQEQNQDQVPRQELKQQKEVFVLDESFVKEPKPFHPLLSFVDFEGAVYGDDSSQEKSVTNEDFEEQDSSNESSIYYIYYYPKVLSQEFAIQVTRTDTQAQWTLYRDPVTKELLVLEKEKTLKEIQLQ